MKLFIVLSLLLVSVLAYESNNNNNNNNRNDENDDSNSNEWQSSYRNGNSNHQGGQRDVNGLTSENLGELFQRQSQNRLDQRTRSQNNNNNDDSSLGYWASYPDAAAFDAKIKARLSSSRTLADKPEVRRKITQLAEDKYNQCKTLADERERACLGRVTGQVMQLVSAVENMARNPQ